MNLLYIYILIHFCPATADREKGYFDEQENTKKRKKSSPAKASKNKKRKH